MLQQNCEKPFVSLRVVNDNEILRNTSDGLEGKSVNLLGGLYSKL